MMLKCTGSIVLDVESDFVFDNKYTFEFHLKPQANERARYSRINNLFYTPKKTALFKKELLRQLQFQWKQEPLEQALYVECIFKLERQKSVRRPHHIVKPDCSNLIKGVEDAFNGHIWKDDSYITGLMILKKYSDTNGIDLNVYTIK
jgi:Holliday junction resolvase RusA-like endonuclease